VRKLVIQQLREDRGWSQTYVAGRAGTHQSNLSRIEQGIVQPDDELLARLAAVFGVEPAFVLLRPVEDGQVGA
jgi:transcriptional regulator with XRE-family HTH domain